MAVQKSFRDSFANHKLPICVLDPKWHRMFALGGKPESVVNKEEILNDLLEQQGKAYNDGVELKKLKSKLMNSIVANMEGAQLENEDTLSQKKLEENRRRIDEINVKLEENEDLLLELPVLIKKANEDLMEETMAYCYDKMRENIKEAEEINDWIIKVRVELKKNIIKKQNREVNSRQIYGYMHDLFGLDVMDIFDLQNDDIDLTIFNKKSKQSETKSEGHVKAKTREGQQVNKTEDFKTS